MVGKIFLNFILKIFSPVGEHFSGLNPESEVCQYIRNIFVWRALERIYCLDQGMNILSHVSKLGNGFWSCGSVQVLNSVSLYGIRLWIIIFWNSASTLPIEGLIVQKNSNFILFPESLSYNKNIRGCLSSE